MAANHAWRFLPILFWVAVRSLASAPGDAGFVPGTVRSGQPAALSGELWAVLPALRGLWTGGYFHHRGRVLLLGIWVGITVARPELFAWTALGLAVFAALQHSAGAGYLCLDRPLAGAAEDAGDSGRGVHGGGAGPATAESGAPRSTGMGGWKGRAERAEQFRKISEPSYEPWLKTANAVQEWLPPGRPRVPRAGRQGQPAGQACWDLLGSCGCWFAGRRVSGARLRAEYRGENLGWAPGRKKAVASLGKGLHPEQGGPGRGRSGSAGGVAVRAYCRGDGKGTARPAAHLAAALCDRRAPGAGVRFFQHVSQHVVPRGPHLCVGPAAVPGLRAAGVHAVVLQQPGRRRSGDPTAVSIPHAHPDGAVGQESVSFAAVRSGRAAGRGSGEFAPGPSGGGGGGGQFGMAAFCAA